MKNKTKKKQKSETNWNSVLSDTQLILLAMVFINGVNVFQTGFSWLGMGVFISSLLFVLMTIYLKNTKFIN